MRQCPDRYTIRAGRNLPDKEFRYLRTVIVTAAVYWGFNSELSLLLLTFRHRAAVTPYTSSFDLAESCVFDKQSPGPILCGSFEHSLFRSYGVNLPSSLTTLPPLALEFSSCPPVSVCGTGIYFYSQSFSRPRPSTLPYSNFSPFRPGITITRDESLLSVSILNSFGGYGISTVCASATPFGLTLAPDLLGADEPSSKNLRLSAIMILT